MLINSHSCLARFFNYINYIVAGQKSQEVDIWYAVGIPEDSAKLLMEFCNSILELFQDDAEMEKTKIDAHIWHVLRWRQFDKIKEVSKSNGYSN